MQYKDSEMNFTQQYLNAEKPPHKSVFSLGDVSAQYGCSLFSCLKQTHCAGCMVFMQVHVEGRQE